MKADLVKAAKRLWETVPRPAQAKARAQKSWAELRVGQKLRARDPILGKPVGSVWAVVETTNLGATLECDGMKLHLATRQWKTLFDRVKGGKGANRRSGAVE